MPDTEREALAADLDRHIQRSKALLAAGRLAEARQAALLAVELKRALSALPPVPVAAAATPAPVAVCEPAPPVSHDYPTTEADLDCHQQGVLHPAPRSVDHPATDADLNPITFPLASQASPVPPPSAMTPEDNSPATAPPSFMADEPEPADYDWLPMDDADHSAAFGDDLDDYDPTSAGELADIDDVDAALTPPPPGRQDETTDDLREVRARREAARLAAEYGWDAEGIEVMTDVFTRYFWSSAKKAMKEQLEAGMTPGQLRLALLARQIWAESAEFHVSLAADEFRDFGCKALSWSMAVALAEELGEDASEDDVLNWLDEQRDEWRTSPALLQAFPAFYAYLRDYLGLTSERPAAGWFHR